MESLFAVFLSVDRNELGTSHENDGMIPQPAVLDGCDIDVKVNRDGPTGRI
jgi:hypothetical protein